MYGLDIGLEQSFSCKISLITFDWLTFWVQYSIDEIQTGAITFKHLRDQQISSVMCNLFLWRIFSSKPSISMKQVREIEDFD